MSSSGQPQAADDGVSSYITVSVSGTLKIPYKFDLLEGLEDPVMEGEILKESVRMAVSERLGHFDHMTVEVDPSPRPVGRNTVSRACKANLDLNKLGQCVESIQSAYDHLMAHAGVLHELLMEHKDAGQEHEQHQAILTVVESMLKGPESVVAAAAELQHSPEFQAREVDDGSEAGENDSEYVKDEDDEEEGAVKGAGYRPLLGGSQTSLSDDFEDLGVDGEFDKYSSSQDESALEAYEQQGYTAL